MTPGEIIVLLALAAVTGLAVCGEAVGRTNIAVVTAAVAAAVTDRPWGTGRPIFGRPVFPARIVLK